MPKERCWSCHLVKNGVKLCGDDRLCPECDKANEQQLIDIKAQNVNASAPAGKGKEKDKDRLANDKLTNLQSGKQGTSINDSHKKSSGLQSSVKPQSDQGAVAEGSSGSSLVASEVTSDSQVQRKTIIVNELLSYACFYRDKSTFDSLKRTVLNFFSVSEITQAKKCITHEFQQLIGSSPCMAPFMADRRNSSTRLAHEAEIEDILGLLEVLDNQTALQEHLFVAHNLGNIPKFGPEEINIAAVVDRQVRVDEAVQKLTTAVDTLSAKSLQPETRDSLIPIISSNEGLESLIRDLQLKLDSFTSSVNARLDHLNSVCISKSNSNSMPSQVVTKLVDDKRDMNIVVFGVKEDKDAAVWRCKVDDILHYVSGHNVDTVDIYRVGRFSETKIRPVIVKLRTVWDKRIILSGCRKLKSYTDKVFIAADEPLELRRQKLFDRLKQRAEREGRAVRIHSDVLMIDGADYFSISKGFIKNIISNHNG